jgi:hypothetical protein
VPDLVPDDEPQLLVVEQVQQPGVDDDERMVGAERHRVRRRVLPDVDLRDLRHVQDVAGVAHHVVQVVELVVADADRPAEEHQPQRPLVDQPRQLAQDDVEPGQRAQRDQRRTVRRVFVGPGTDPGKARPCPIRCVLRHV